MNLPSKLLKKTTVSFIDILAVFFVVSLVLVVVLAVINPLERLRQKQDSETLALAQTLASALSTYHAQSEQPPWEATNTNDSPTTDNPRPQQTWLEELERSGNLEKGIRKNTNLKEYLVINTAPTKVCFYPASVHFRQMGKYDKAGVKECLPQGFTPCYVCFEY